MLHHRLGSNAEIIFDGKTAKTAAEKAELLKLIFAVYIIQARQNA